MKYYNIEMQGVLEEEAEDGEWCRWDDVEELEKENEDLKGQIQDLLYEIKTLS